MMHKGLSLAMLGSVLLFAGCANTPEDVVPSASQHLDTQQLKSASEAFKDEYESLNASGAVFMEVPSDITIYSLDFSQTQEFLTKGTGILYFGFPTCPWCRNLLPELFTTMQKNQISDLYYFNPKFIRDKKTLDENGQLVVEIPTSDEYQRLLDTLGERLPEYKELNDPKLRRLYVPFVVFVKDGKILADHLSTLDEQIDPTIPLTAEQKKKLITILTTKMMPLVGETCAISATPSESC